MNFFQIFSLIIFLLQNTFILIPVNFYLFDLNLLTAPPIAVILLLATTAITPQVFIKGIVGDNLLKPFNIMILFISLAYLALSLNRTGLLKYLAFRIAKSSRGESSKSLLTKFYAFSLILSIIMGNDPIILAATGFLVYFTSKSKQDSIPFIFTEFSSSNIGSMVLFCGNPTNLIVCEGFEINFLEYSKHMLLPFVGCALSCYALSVSQFSGLLAKNIDAYPPRIVETIRLNRIEVDNSFSNTGSDGNLQDISIDREQVEILEEDGEGEDIDKILTDPISAIVGSIVFISCIITIVVVSFFNVDVWVISLSFTAFKICFDIIWDIQCPSAVDIPAWPSHYPFLIPFYRTLPTVATTFVSLPFGLVLFAFSQFILIEALTFHSWITIFAARLAPLMTTLASTTAVIGVLTIVLCATLGTNITATILLTRVIVAIKLEHPLSTAAWISLALGSNIGAVNITISSSIAGLLWKDILKSVGIDMTQKVFWKWNWRPLLGMCLIGYLVVYLQVLLN